MAIQVFVAALALVGLVNSAPSLPTTSPVTSKWYPLNHQAFPFNPVPTYMTPITAKDQEQIEDEWEDTQEMALESLNSIRPTFSIPRWTPVPTRPTETMDRVTAMYCGSNMMCPQGTKLMPMKTVQQLVRCLCITFTSN